MGLISRVSSRTYRCYMNLELFFINLPNKYGLNGKYYRDCVNERIRHPSKLRPIIHYSLQYESVQGKNVNNSQTYEKFVDFLNTFGSTACLEKLSADLEKMKKCDNLEFSSTNIANLDLTNFPSLGEVHKSAGKRGFGKS